nr:MAG TPA: hypothetical protein [Caudoviricetes sp.]
MTMPKRYGILPPKRYGILMPKPIGIPHEIFRWPTTYHRVECLIHDTC